MWNKRFKRLPENESFATHAKNMAKCHYCSGYHAIHFKVVAITPKKNAFLYWYEIECNDDNTAMVDVRSEVTAYKMLWFRKDNTISITSINDFIDQIKMKNSKIHQ